ncbi:MAG TPA: EAL domain-containing protein, partial [Verrucomicrobiae bacterium]|nr:EAL domain-containing protein [Verrucomicrobiae bacterium]
LPVGITITDTDGRIIYVNPADAGMHGYTPEELLGREASIFGPPGLRGGAPDTRAVADAGIWRRETVNLRKNLSEFPVQLTSIAVRSADGRCLGMVTACEDITARKEAESKIFSLAYHDTLTGLPNRQMCLDRLHQALSAGRRDGTRLAILFLDLDHFKDINDTRGHDVGDVVLTMVAERLSATIRDSDTVARLGGDEFIVLLTPVNAENAAATAARRVLSLFSEPFLVDGRRIHSSASIGIAMFPDDGADGETLFKCADTAMYHAKSEGRGKYRFFSPEMNRKIMRRVALENSLRQAIPRGELFVVYQPQWDLNTLTITGVEVLARWRNADLGLLHPSEFIPVAENIGLIGQIGEFVLRTACSDSRNWGEAGKQVRLAVNLSGVQLKQETFLRKMERFLRESGLDPHTLDLEFTESVMMEHGEKGVTLFRALKRMGCQLTIDDFGTGYSSLSYLKHFPIDRIKIDRSFLAGLGSDPRDAAVIDAILSMARSLDIQVVAEGVESRSQLQFLLERGCHEAQGFYFAKPVSAAGIARYLREFNMPRLQPLPRPIPLPEAGVTGTHPPQSVEGAL